MRLWGVGDYVELDGLTQDGKERLRKPQADPKYQDNLVGRYNNDDDCMQAMAALGTNEGHFQYTLSGD